AVLLRTDSSLHPGHRVPPFLCVLSPSSGPSLTPAPCDRSWRSALREEALDLLRVVRVHVDGAVEAARARRRLLLEQVLAHRLLPAEHAGAGLAEPLRGGLGGFH